MIPRTLIILLCLVLLFISAPKSQSEYCDGEESSVNLHGGAYYNPAKAFTGFGVGVSLTLGGKADVGLMRDRITQRGVSKDYLGGYVDFLLFKPKELKFPIAMGFGFGIPNLTDASIKWVYSGTLFVVIYSDENKGTRIQPTVGLSYIKPPHGKEDGALLIGLPIRFHEVGSSTVALEPGFSFNSKVSHWVIGLTIMIGE